MEDPEAVLPLYLDPQVEAGRQDWAMISSGFPDEEYYNFDGKADEGVGLCDVQTEGSCNRDQVKRVVWEFDLPPPVHGTHVLAATFQAWETHAWDCSPDWVELWLTGAITSGTNWNNHAGSWSRGLASVNIARKSGCPNPPGWVAFNAAAVVEQAAREHWGTVTLGLKAGNEGGSMPGSWKRFRNDAQLIINYNTVPPVPDELSTVGTSQRLSCGATGRMNTTGGAGLTATVRDADPGSAVLARFEWQDVTAGSAVVTLPDTPSVAPPHAFQASLPASSLPNGHTIQWRVRGFDGTDVSESTPWCPFIVDNAPPGQPTITATDLPAFPGAPPDTTQVGRPVVVTFNPAPGDTDIVGYYVGVGAVEPVPTMWVPAWFNGIARAPVVPVASGLSKNFLTVVAVDQAGNRSLVPPTAPSGPGTLQFRANPGAVTAGVPGDATGDGRADVTGLLDVGNGNSTLWRWDSLGVGSGLTEPVAVQDVATTYPTGSTRIVSGDFDGDRLSDVAVFRQDGANVRLTVQRAAGNGLFGAPAQVITGWNLNNVKPMAANFDADASGRDDVAVVYDDGNTTFSIRVLVANGGPGTPTFAAPVTWYTSPQGSADWNRMKVFPGDLDGDGRVDVGYIYEYGTCQTRMSVHYAAGVSFAQGVELWNSGPAGSFCWGATELLPGDFDGDGRGDVVAWQDLGLCTATLIPFHGNANRTMTLAGRVWTSAAGAWCGGRTTLSTAHATGDPRTDIAAIYRCCNGYHVRVYTFASIGRTFEAPRLKYRGAVGPRGTPANANLAVGAKATASSTGEAGGWTLPSVTDGTRGGIGWSSASNPGADHTEWLELALPEPGEVNRVMLIPRGDAPFAGLGFPVDFTIEVFDGAAWTTVVTRTGYPPPNTGSAQVFTFAVVTATRIRVTGTSIPVVLTERHMQLAEVEAYRI